MTSSRHSFSLGLWCSQASPLPQRPSLRSAVTHLPILVLVNPRCCYTNAKWKSSTGLLSKHVVWRSGPSPAHRAISSCQRSQSFQLCSVLHQEGMSRPMCLKEVTLGLAAPASSSRGPVLSLFSCPWVCETQQWLYPHSRTSASRLRCGSSQRLPVQPGSAWPQTGIQKPNVCCGHLMCVCLILIPVSSHVVKLMSGGIS